jgi:hypothetical protein
VRTNALHGGGTSPARHSGAAGVVDDVRDPGDAFIQAEIDANRRYEYSLIPKALIAFAVVAALITVRQLFFV